jgi:hypothetical protein
MAAAPIALDALGPNGSYHARNRLTVADVAGAPVAELSMVPRLYVNRAIAALRGATTQPAEQRADALALAGRIFLKETVEGLSPDRYERAVSRVSGVPVSVVRSAAAEIADAADRAWFSACQARPEGAVPARALAGGPRPRLPRRGTAVAARAVHPAPPGLRAAGGGLRR